MASFKAAIEWLARNEDLMELVEHQFSCDDCPLPVSAILVADLWHKTEQQVADELERTMRRFDLIL